MLSFIRFTFGECERCATAAFVHMMMGEREREGGRKKEARTQINIVKKGLRLTAADVAAAIAMLNLYYLINSMIFSSAGGSVRIHSTSTPWHFNLKINCFSLGRAETWPIYSMCAFHTTARVYLCIWTGAFYRRRIYVDIVVRRFKSNKLMVHTETVLRTQKTPEIYSDTFGVVI